MNPLRSPNRRRFGGPIHTKDDLRRARDLSFSAMDKWCEIERKGLASAGFGDDDGPPVPAGRVRCGIAQGTRGEETTRPNEGAQSGFEWEFILPLGTSIESECRLAWPAFFPLWEAGKNWEAGAIVAPANWISGTAPFFKCVVAGQSGLVEPEWSHVLGDSVEDGGCVWELIGWATKFEVISVAVAQSHPTQLVVRAKEIG